MWTPLCPLFYLKHCVNKEDEAICRNAWYICRLELVQLSPFIKKNVQKECPFFKFISLIFQLLIVDVHWIESEETACLQTSKMLKDKFKKWLKIRRKWETGSISLVVLILVVVTLAASQTAAAMHQRQLSLMVALLCVRHCFLPVEVVSAWRGGMLQQPRLPSLTCLWEGGCPNYMIQRAPNSPYSPQLTFINYSLLFLEAAFWISSPLRCAHCCAGNKLWRSLSIWLNAAIGEHTHTCAPLFAKWCCDTMSAFHGEGWNKYERRGHLQCSNVGTAHTPSL